MYFLLHEIQIEQKNQKENKKEKNITEVVETKVEIEEIKKEVIKKYELEV